MSAIVTRVPSHTQPQGDGSRIQTTHIALKMCRHVAAVHSSCLSLVPQPQRRRHGLHPPPRRDVRGHALSSSRAGSSSNLLDVASSKTRPSPLSPMCRRTQPQGDGPHTQTTHIALKMCRHVAAVHSSCLSLVPQPQRRPPNHQTEVTETMLFPHRVLAPRPSPQTSPSQRAHHRCHPRAATHNRSDGPHTPTTHIALQMCCHCCGNPPLASIVCSSTPTTTGAPPRLPDRGHKGHALSSSRIGSSFLL